MDHRGKLAVFVAIAMVATVNTLDQPLDGDARSYRAVFSDATGLVTGSGVRIAGVRVGKVTGVRLDDGRAVVDFDVEADQPIPSSDPSRC